MRACTAHICMHRVAQVERLEKALDAKRTPARSAQSVDADELPHMPGALQVGGAWLWRVDQCSGGSNVAAGVGDKRMGATQG